MEKIPVNTGSKAEKINRILNLLKSLNLPKFKQINSLRNKEIEVLSELLGYYHELGDLNQINKFKIIFESGSTTDICRKLNISKAVFYNIIKDLRKEGIIGDKSIDHKFLYFDVEEIGFKFI